jgi:hypothetical protein
MLLQSFGRQRILSVFSDWGCLGQAVSSRFPVKPIPVGHSLLFAVSAWLPHDGVRRARRLNLSRDLEALLPAGSGLSSEIASPIVPTGTTRVRPAQRESGSPLIMPRQPGRSACPSGTRGHRPTCGAERPPTCGRRPRAPGPCLGAWRCSCPKPARLTILCFE